MALSLVVTVILVLAMASLLAVPDFADVWENLWSDEMRFSLRLSLVSAFLSAALVISFSLPIGYTLSRFSFPFKGLVKAIIDLPMAFPELVLGLITHDLDDVWTLADKAAVFHDGRCRQFGPADEVLDRPADPFVADFVGTNLLEGAVLERKDDRSLVGVNGFALYSRDGAEVGKSVQLAIRPENIRIIRTPPADSDCLAVTIESVAREARACVLQIRASETCLSVVAAHQSVQRLDLHPGDQVYARIEKENVCIVGSS